MPVQTPHSEYAFRKPDWQKIRCFAEGSRVVKAQGVTFLPKPKGWSDDEYSAYKQRAEVYGAIDRTIDGLDGAIFRKAPKVELPNGSDDIENDITLSGKTLVEWLRDSVREVLTIGRGGVLVDFTGAPVEQAANPDAVARASVERPYVVPYLAEQVINWETQIIGGVTKLVTVVLEEKVSEPSPVDLFIKMEQIRYRVLRLTNGVYSVEIWTGSIKPVVPQANIAGTAQATSEMVYVKTQEFIPQRRGQSLDAIPFYFLGVSGQSIAPEKPPLLDVVDLNILHYGTSADYAHGLHWVALPTPWITGATDQEKSFGIGPSTAIVLGDPNAKVGMLEFNGQGLQSIEKRLSGLEAKMAALGAKILEERKTQAESGTAIQMRQAGDASVLAGISDAVSRAAEAIVARMLWWAGTEQEQPDVSIDLNMEFFGVAMDPQLLTALMQAQQAGLISKETFLWNMQKGEMLPEDRTIEDEMAKTETETPPGMQGITATTQPKLGADGKPIKQEAAVA